MLSSNFPAFTSALADALKEYPTVPGFTANVSEAGARYPMYITLNGNVVAVTEVPRDALKKPDLAKMARLANHLANHPAPGRSVGWTSL